MPGQIKHGYALAKVYSKTYHAWTGMKFRCDNPRAEMFKYYGERGITYCDEWIKFENFLADMGEAPPGLSLERIDSNGPYCKDNCKWATAKEQGGNKRNNRLLTHDGETHHIAEWVRITGIPFNTIDGRLKRHWTVAKTLGFISS